MTVKHLFILIFLFCLFGCSDNSEIHINGTGKKQFGLYIENSQRRGSQFFDSTMTEYDYRYYNVIIMNDSIIPVRLAINLYKMDTNSLENLESKVFLLPTRLVPEKQHLYQNIPKKIKRFLENGIDKPIFFNKTLKPTEKCILTFGVLTNTKYLNPTTPFGPRLLTTNENSSKFSFKLRINDYLIIPCGHFSYIDK